MAQSDQTAERQRPSLHLVPGATTAPQHPRLAETALQPAVPQVGAAREQTTFGPMPRQRGHSAWEQTFWVLFIFLVIVTIIGVWLIM